MTTTQMLLQMGSQLQSIASQQVSRPQSATDQSGRDPSDFQSMLEDKQNQVTQQQPDQSQPAQDEPGLAPEQPDVQAAQTLAAMLVLPLQQPVVSTEQLPIQEEGTVQGVLLTGIETAPQTPVQTAQTAVETGPQSGQTQQAVPTQAQTAQVPAQNTQTETQAPVQTAQGQQQTQQTVVQTAQTDDGQQADARQSEGRSSAAATVQKPQAEAEVTQTQTAPAAEQPLFRQVEHTPVKVGDAAPLDTTAEDFDAQAAKTIAQALEKGSQKVELKLSPANLGNVTVELTRTAEGVIHVVLTAEREQAMKLLTDHAGQLGNLLQNNTGADVRVEVPQNQQGRQAWQEGQGQHHQGQSQQQQSHSQQEQEDFLQQLRLGLIQLEEGG